MSREIRTRADVDVERSLREAARAVPRARAAGAALEAATEVAATEAAEAQPEDKFLDRLVKYIPGEIIAVYLPIQAQLLSMNDPAYANLKWGFLWGVFALLTLLTVVYLKRFQDVKKPLQLAISAVAFVVWVLGTGGGPFLVFGHEELFTRFGPILIPLFTLVAAVIEPPPAPRTT